MAKTKGTKGPKINPKQAKKAAYLSENSGVPLHGQIVTWNASGPHTLPKVIEALTDSGLDPKLARTLLPRHAFSRACRKLSEERVIDLFKEHEDSLVFQFTKKSLEQTGIEFHKETFVTLNKITGVVDCPNDQIKKLAQDTLDNCMVERTTSDITNIVQKLFEKHAEIIPVRDQGGAYFVPRMFSEFVDRVGAFLGKLGGKLNPWPIAAGTAQGDKTVTDSVTEYMGSLVQEHQVAVESFGVDTRKDVLERAAERIKTTKMKLEAYAEWLGEQSQTLATSLEEHQEKLLKRIDEVAAIQAATPEGAKVFKGFRPASKAGMMDAAITPEPKPLAEVAKAAGWNVPRMLAHIKYWRDRGAPYHLNGEGTVQRLAKETA
jgi:hypothetical protein